MKPILLLVLLAATLPAQVLEGDLVNAATGAPVVGAHLSLAAMNGTGRAFAVSDAAGHFRLLVADPQPFVTVTHPGFLTIHPAWFHPGRTAPSNIRIELTPESLITGKIEDEDGFPVEQSFVQALRYQIVSGGMKIQPAAPPAQTNDLGEFRLAALPAGRYYLCMSPGNASHWDTRYTGECYPGLPDLQGAKAIELKAGQEVDLPVFRLPRRLGVTVSGRLELPPDLPAIRMRIVSLQPSERYRFGMGTSTTLQSDGSFTIPHVPPGNYSLRFSSGQSYPPKPGDFSAEEQIHIADSDLRGIVLTPHEAQAIHLAGKVIADDGSAPGALTIGLRPMIGTTPAVTSDEDGTFEFEGLPPGHYDIMVTRPPTMPIRPSRSASPVSAQLGDREVLQSGFDLDGTPAGPLNITVSARFTQLTGRLLDAAGHGIVRATVLLVGAEGRVLMGTGSDGSYGSSSFLPGDYRVYVLADDSQFALLDDSEYLKAHKEDLPPVHVPAGLVAPLTLRLPPAK